MIFYVRGCEMARICRWCGLIAVALIMVMSCNKEENKREHNIAIDAPRGGEKNDIPFKENSIDIPITTETLVIGDNKNIPPLPPAPIPIGDGYGGGSQGALQPFEYSHDDDDNKETPHGICSNGSQEVLANNNGCPFLLYGVANDSDDDSSTLLAFDLEDGGFVLPIGNIDANIIDNITGIDFSPEGVLYAVGQNNDNEYILATIDCRNASPTFINKLGLDGLGLKQLSPYTTTDISFDSFGRLYAYIRNSVQDRLGYVITATGLISSYIDIGDTNLADSDNFGLGNKPFPFDTLYHAGTSLYNISKSTGLSTSIAPLSFFDPANNNPFINALDADYFTQIMYASIENSGSHYLGILDTLTGEVSFLSEPPLEVPYDLKAIAINRRYEACDPLAIEPVLPSGSTCTEDCHLIESNCADGLDNDGNGLIDCADEACQNQTCNDNDVCTYNDTCTNLCANEELPCVIASPWQCVGKIEPCYDGNECTIDRCEPDEENEGGYICVYEDIDTTNYGSCTPDDSCSVRNPDGSCPSDNITNFCLLGTCVDGSCEEENKSQVSTNEGGCCMGFDYCRVNICVPETGQCLYGTSEDCCEATPL